MNDTIQDFIRRNEQATSFIVTVYGADGMAKDIGEFFVVDSYDPKFGLALSDIPETLTAWAFEHESAAAFEVQALAGSGARDQYTLDSATFDGELEPMDPQLSPRPNKYVWGRDKTGQLVTKAAREGLVTSIRHRDGTEGGVGLPQDLSRVPFGAALSGEHRDVSITNTASRDTFVVQAHSELGVIFLKMLAEGEL